MNDLGRQKKFRNKILVFMFGSMLLPLTVAGLLAYKSSLHENRQSFEQRLQQTAHIVHLQTRRWSDGNLTLLKFLVREIGFHDRDEWTFILQGASIGDTGAFTAHVSDLTGQNVARSDGMAFNNYSDREYFKRALKGEVYSEALMARVHKRPALCTAGPVVIEGETRFVVTLCSLLEKLSADIGAIRIGETGYAVLVNEHGRILAHPALHFLSDGDTPALKGLIARSLQTPQGRIEFKDREDPYVAFVETLPNGWKVISAQSSKEISALSKATLVWPVVMGSSVLTLFMILTYFFVDRLTYPLHRLASIVRKFGRGDLDARAEVDSPDEIGLLAANFNLMATQIKATIQELKFKEHLLARHRDELHQKVIEQSQKLLYAAKMSSLGEMAGGIAHEVNNPLAIISLKAHRLKEGMASGRLTPDEAREIAVQIERTCLRITQIIRGLRTFSRDGSRDPMVEENLCSILAETENLCSESLRARDIRLEIDCPPTLSLECQPVQLSQVFLNLIVNSRDAINHLPEKWIRIQCIGDRDRIVIKFTDSGSGIPEPLRSQMMQPFFTTKPIGEGTGLGLSICKGIVEHHKGALIYNPDFRNTQFLISLPVRQAPASDARRSDLADLPALGPDPG